LVFWEIVFSTKKFFGVLKGGEMIKEMTKKIRLFTLLLAAALFAQDASATLEPILESSYYDGFVFYYEDGLFGRIDFAVYDTSVEENNHEYLDIGITKPGDGQYIYAYQIFNDYSFSAESVAYFALLGINGDSIDIDSITSQEDPESGIEPGGAYLNEDDFKIVWEFDGDAGYIIAGEHSWFLIFSSDNDWVAGSYEIKGPDDVPVPVPEPATVALLGIGSMLILLKRRRYVK
jgi:hypothetical protein